MTNNFEINKGDIFIVFVIYHKHVSDRYLNILTPPFRRNNFSKSVRSIWVLLRMIISQLFSTPKIFFYFFYSAQAQMIYRICDMSLKINMPIFVTSSPFPIQYRKKIP